MAIYTYSLSTNFAGDIATSTLWDEIAANATIISDPIRIDVIGDVVSIEFSVTLTAPQIAALNTAVANHSKICKSGLVFGKTFSDVVSFGSTSNNVQNTFLNNADNGAASNASAPIALSPGRIVFVSISSDGNASYYIDLVRNAVSGGAGTYSGGTVIGSVLKPLNVKDATFDLYLSSFNFFLNDRISAYIRAVSGGGAKPLVRCFLDYSV